MTESTIAINVELDENKFPSTIHWNASASTASNKQAANAMLLSLWDAADKAALRIDLWTKEMRVDEMADFFYQTFMGMADAYQRATHHQELAHDIQHFAKEFYQKFRAIQLAENKLI
jgi:gliding motility-associated protein GldC